MICKSFFFWKSKGTLLYTQTHPKVYTCHFLEEPYIFLAFSSFIYFSVIFFNKVAKETQILLNLFNKHPWRKRRYSFEVQVISLFLFTFFQIGQKRWRDLNSLEVKAKLRQAESQEHPKRTLATRPVQP